MPLLELYESPVRAQRAVSNGITVLQPGRLTLRFKPGIFLAGISSKRARRDVLATHADFEATPVASYAPSDSLVPLVTSALCGRCRQILTSGEGNRVRRTIGLHT